MKKFIKRLLKLCIVLGVLGGIGYAVLDAKPRAPKVQYRMETVMRGDIAQSVSASGTLNPTQVVEVGTQVSGKILKLNAKQNEQVKEGDLLAEIDPALLESQLKQSKSSLQSAKVSLDQAERDLKRTRTLVEKDYVARVDLERAEQAALNARNSYDSAKAQVEKDEINLNYTKIYSPITGVVIDQVVNEGQTMTAGYQTPTLFKIANDLGKMKIDVSLSEADIGRVKKGLPVVFTVDAYPDRKFSGVVQSVNLSPENQQGVVTYKVTVSVDNPEHLLVPGMTAYVSVILDQKKNVLYVPMSVLRFQPPAETQEPGTLQRLFGGAKVPSQLTAKAAPPGMHTIYLLKNGVLEPVYVKKGLSNDSQVEISGNGVAEGDKAVASIIYTQ